MRLLQMQSQNAVARAQHSRTSCIRLAPAAAAGLRSLGSSAATAVQAAICSRLHVSSSLQRHPRSRGIISVAAAAADTVEAEQLIGPHYMDRDVAEMLEYATRLCFTAETYEIHSWMLLLAVLKHEDSVAAQVLVELGLDDLYGAWHEVLWALKVTDGLQPRAFCHLVTWGQRARAIAQGAVKFAGWAGRDKVASQDLLLAFAASDVLKSLFPDVDLSFDRVKRAIERRTGEVYDLPNYEGGSAVDSQDMFL